MWQQPELPEHCPRLAQSLRCRCNRVALSWPCGSLHGRGSPSAVSLGAHQQTFPWETRTIHCETAHVRGFWWSKTFITLQQCPLSLFTMSCPIKANSQKRILLKNSIGSKLFGRRKLAIECSESAVLSLGSRNRILQHICTVYAGEASVFSFGVIYC